jgi:hypothetical protein
VTGAVVTCNDGFERRARVMPWGIEVQVWRLVDTVTIPGTAATLPLNALFPDSDIAGAVPSARNDNEKTLENLIDDPTTEDCVELVAGAEDDAPMGQRTAAAPEARGSHGR